MAGLLEVASHSDVNFVVSAMTGSIGILPTVQAIKAWKGVGLANKEVLVSAGALVMRLAQEYEVPIIPIDSEHSAIFQCLQGNSHKDVRRLILTASGGPFLHTPAQRDQNRQSHRQQVYFFHIGITPFIKNCGRYRPKVHPDRAGFKSSEYRL